MLHLIREASLERVLENFAEPEEIPRLNIEVAREQGLEVMQTLLEECRSAGREKLDV